MCPVHHAVAVWNRLVRRVLVCVWAKVPENREGLRLGCPSPRRLRRSHLWSRKGHNHLVLTWRPKSQSRLASTIQLYVSVPSMQSELEYLNVLGRGPILATVQALDVAARKWGMQHCPVSPGRRVAVSQGRR